MIRVISYLILRELAQYTDRQRHRLVECILCRSSRALCLTQGMAADQLLLWYSGTMINQTNFSESTSRVNDGEYYLAVGERSFAPVLLYNPASIKNSWINVRKRRRGEIVTFVDSTACAMPLLSLLCSGPCTLWWCSGRGRGRMAQGPLRTLGTLFPIPKRDRD